VKFTKKTVLGKEWKTPKSRRRLIKWLFLPVLIYVVAGVILGVVSFYDVHDPSREEPFVLSRSSTDVVMTIEDSEIKSTEVQKIEFQELQIESQNLLKISWDLCVQDLVMRQPNALIPTELIIDVVDVDGGLKVQKNTRGFEQCLLDKGFDSFVLDPPASQKNNQGRYRLRMP
jgi:hypothetical protein